MQAKSEVAAQTIGEVSDADIDQVLAAYGGDARDTIRTLLVEQASLEQEILRLASPRVASPDAFRWSA